MTQHGHPGLGARQLGNARTDVVADAAIGRTTAGVDLTNRLAARIKPWTRLGRWYEQRAGSGSAWAMTRRAIGTDNPLWDYSLATYSKPGVAAACLALQDRCGLDVNLLLLCCWLGAEGRRLDKEMAGKLIELTADWQREVVMPLRRIRRRLKGGDALEEVFRSQIKGQELSAERLEQDRLLAFVGQGGSGKQGGPALAAANLKTYLHAAEQSVGITDTADLGSLLAGCFDGVPPLEAVWLLGG